MEIIPDFHGNNLAEFDIVSNIFCISFDMKN